MQVKRVFTFDAAHHLPNYNGKCANIHGHTYTLEVYIQGPLLSNGMVMDFHDVDKLVKENVLNDLDHKDLNTKFDNPTGENIVMFIVSILRQKLKDYDTSHTGTQRKLVRVVLWESPKNEIIWEADE